jgi:hypothetical protein
MADWLIAYADGSTITSDDMGPDEVPRRGVICIVQTEPSCGKRTLVQQNYYAWHREQDMFGQSFPGKWVPHDINGLGQYRADSTEPGVYLEGYWVSDELYAEIVRRARSDPRLPKATAGPPPLRDEFVP